MQVLFLHEQAQKQAIEPGVQVPVEEAQVVADDVVAIVGELDALAFAFAAAFPFHPAEENLARHQLQLFQPGQEMRIEQRWCGGVRHDRSGMWVKYKFKSGKQTRCINFPRINFDNAPALAITAVDAHGWIVGALTRVHNPVFSD